jgi:hypothetical protein
MCCGRQGDIEGLFVLKEDAWNQLQKDIKNKSNMSFYEVLGKHSHIAMPLSEDYITMICDDQEFLKKLTLFVGWHLGGVYLPDYIEEDLGK